MLPAVLLLVLPEVLLLLLLLPEVVQLVLPAVLLLLLVLPAVLLLVQYRHLPVVESGLPYGSAPPLAEGQLAWILYSG
jgi:hypothetical protein